MKKSLLRPLYILIFSLLLPGFVAAQQDSLTVPVLLEQPSFYNYNFLYKKRLDSIQKMVPLPYNEFVQKYIDIYSSRKDMFGKMLGLSSYYFPIFEQALKSYNIPEEIKYLPIIESSMDPLAVSRTGATGLWQFMYTTAKGYRLTMDEFIDERRDPLMASNAAAAYFRDSYADLGDWLLCLAAYNCGKGAVTRAMAKAGSKDFWVIRPFLPLETRNYVPAFIAAVYMMNCAKAHQVNAQQCPMILKTDVLLVDHHVSLPLLAQALDVEESILCGLNPGYKKKIVNGSVAAPKRLIMPKASLANFALVYEVLNSGSNVTLVPEPGKKYISYKPGASQAQSASGKM